MNNPGLSDLLFKIAGAGKSVGTMQGLRQLPRMAVQSGAALRRIRPDG